MKMFHRTRCIPSLLWLALALTALPLHTIHAQAQNKRVVDSLRLALQTAQGVQKVHILNDLCWEYRTSDHDKAIEYGLQALGLAEQLGYTNGMARSLNALGLVYRRRGNYPQALEYHLKSLKISEEIHDTLRTGASLNNIGLLYLGQGNYTLALEYFERELKVYESANDKSGIGAAMQNIGMVYSRQGKYSLALEYLVKSLAITEQLSDEAGVAECMVEIATLYARQGNPQLAMQNFQKALAMNERIGNKSAIAQILSNVAAIHLQANDTDKAEESALKALKLARAIGEIEWMKESARTLAAVYKLRNDYPKALEYQLLFTSLKDSITGEESVRKIADLQAMLASEKRQAQIDLLTKENQLQMLIRNGLAVVVVLFLALGYVLFRSYRQQKQANTRLSEQNAEILRQQELLEDQAREIELTNTSLQAANLDLQQQQQMLEEQAAEIQMVNNELMELNANLEHQQALLEKQSREIELANIELQERNMQLRELNEQKNEFLAIAAHDLKNPLVSIVMLSSAIKRYFDKMSKQDIIEHSTKIENTAGRMRQIILNLLDLNAIESGKFDVEMEAVAPGEVAEKVLKDWESRAQEKSMTLHFDNQAPDQIVRADPNVLYQVLDNIVSNAVKYSPLGSVVRTRVKRIVRQDELRTTGSPNKLANQPSDHTPHAFVRIEIQDEGPGLSADDKAKLFGRFVRLSARPTGGEHSTGLGLSIVKKMVETMNGSVWCESEVGKGATFIVEFPVLEGL